MFVYHLFSDLVHENGILSSGSDGLPYTTLSYGNGESYTYFRRDLSLVDTSNILLLYMYHTEESMVDQNSVNAQPVSERAPISERAVYFSFLERGAVTYSGK